MYLYKNSRGKPVFMHSHSGGQDWGCPKKYYWKRVEGWQSREEKAALSFGKAVESAIQYFHNRNFEPGSGVDEFKKLWFLEKDNEEIVYTEKSGDWATHYRMGSELLGLYELNLPELPIVNAKFQVKYKEPVFPEDRTSWLSYGGTVDMLCEADNNHPLLPPLEGESTRKLIVDIKTSAASYYVDPRLSSLDDQLRDYAWLSGTQTVAFLVLVKNPTSVDKGDWVTILFGPKAGKKYQVFSTEEGNLKLVTGILYNEFQERKKSIKGKGSKEANEVLYTEYLSKSFDASVESVTKQKIQFLPALISEEDMAESKREALKEAYDIAKHSEENYYPKKPGVRFPNNKCLNCECLPLCIGDEKGIKETLIQITGEF